MEKKRRKRGERTCRQPFLPLRLEFLHLVLALSPWLFPSPNASWSLVFQHSNNVHHFERSIVAVWPFWPSAKGLQILFHQASHFMVHQLLPVLPCFQACRLLVSKLSWWQANEGTLDKKVVWSQRFLVVRLLSNVIQWSGVEDWFCFHHDC